MSLFGDDTNETKVYEALQIVAYDIGWKAILYALANGVLNSAIHWALEEEEAEE